MELFWMLSAESQAALMLFQYCKYGTHLTIPHRPKEPVAVSMDGIEMSEGEMERFMKQKPHSPRRVT